MDFKCESLHACVDNIRTHWYSIVESNRPIKIISIAALPHSDFSACKKFCTKTHARKPFLYFRMTKWRLSVYLNDLNNSDVNFVNNDKLNSLGCILKISLKSSHLRVDGRHKARSDWSVPRFLFVDSKFVTRTCFEPNVQIILARPMDCTFTGPKPRGYTMAGGNVEGYHKRHPKRKTIVEFQKRYRWSGPACLRDRLTKL